MPNGGRPRIVRSPLEAAQAASDGPGKPIRPVGKSVRAALRAAGLTPAVSSLSSGRHRVWVYLRFGLEDVATEEVRATLASLWADGDTRVTSHALLVLVERAGPIPMPPEVVEG